MSKFLKDLKPTPNTVLYMVDDLGFMVASSINGTAVINETARYTPTNNIDPVIFSSANSLVNENGSIDQIPDEYFDTVNLNGTLYLLASRDLVMPISFQIYKVIMVVPRTDFYGATERSTRKALITVGILSSVGVVVVAILSLLAVYPLRKMANSMKQLTKFDFSVLEKGKLKSTSFVLELNIVETSFLQMVKNVLNQSVGGISAFFTRFADEAIISAENPAFTTELKNLTSLDENKFDEIRQYQVAELLETNTELQWIHRADRSVCTLLHHLTNG
ncbi:hypothetical protein HDU76_000271 [Blyttiomyces sp. JEL0837]|nr:hypothetical protein HDU76_000271 [Blyttiomyces sp. JEL0837]